MWGSLQVKQLFKKGHTEHRETIVTRLEALAELSARIEIVRVEQRSELFDVMGMVGTPQPAKEAVDVRHGAVMTVGWSVDCCYRSITEQDRMV